jgi:pSer/pThr/pTyr-binding forkhead associated (FHA) protein
MSAASPDAASEPRLVDDEREWVLGDGENILGRDEGVAIRIDGAGVSRHHARIMVRSGRATIEDLGSKNGTFCGETRVTSPRALADGDVIRLGRRIRFVFRQQEARATETELTTSPSPSGATFKREGAFWIVAFEGQTVQVPDVKGLPDLARLLAQPGAEIHCLELAGRPAEGAGPDEVLDARARREIQLRAQELQREIDDADGANDLGRAERAREELDRLVDTLAGAFGLGGRTRGLGNPAERARSAVTWRIRSAIRKIAAAHPRLGRHLENAVRTGTFCVYSPEAPIDWVT